MQDFRKLQVWQKRHQLSLEVYRITVNFPRREIFGLSSQVRRAAVSITANLAEGCGRNTDADLVRFVQMAFGSACELESHLELARDLKYLSSSDHRKLLDQVVEIKRMLSGLLSKIRT
jgi:four helix bundle protein